MHCDRLRGVHLRGRAEDDRVDIVSASASARSVPLWPMPYLSAVFGGLLSLAANDRDDLDAGDQLEAVEMLFAERAGACECDSS
jgi:hypothetical protein